MEIPSKYNAAEAEKKWYDYWLKHKFFKSEPDDREPFTIVIPPPNVTGVLHMGHIMNNTIQDILIRRARMQGKNACWVPGTDHASIATEAKVVNKLASEGIDKHSLTRDEFLKHAWEWTHKHGGIILEQLKKLGASCDWDRTKFTLDADLYQSVINVFVDLYNKGLIYRGVRMVNWDPKALTAVSDEEVEYKEEQSKLYYICYQIKDSQDFITIATTRPETILGDTAVCVHPEDERYTHLKGAKIIVPLVNREVPLIFDQYVDKEFGTGALKVTPSHDENDYLLGQKHNLPSIDIFNDNGTMSSAAELYIGKDRFEVRQLIVPDLEKAGNLVKIENYTNKVGYSQRSQVVIEPKLSMQWFLKMQEIVKPALENVENDTIKFSPERFKNTYRHWMSNVRDWNISRQLWWGQRIPAYYLPESNDFVVAATAEKALQLAREKTGKLNLQIEDLRQDEDVLDTWFSSWLWPISVFNGINETKNKDISYYYPTNVLVTGHDIIFFWVARMIIAGYEYEGTYPFKDVYFTGMVRDEQGRKMSKQLGNSPDPLDLIAQFGADAVRTGMMFCSPAGGDLLYNDGLPEQGRNFGSKIWNAFRLVKNWQIDEQIAQLDSAKKAVQWFDNKLNEVLLTMEKQFDEFRLSEALMSIYKLFWDDFSSWYLEIIKPAFGQGIDKQTFNSTLEFFEKLLKILHPFMPFITEEIWQLMAQRIEGKSIMISEMPKSKLFDSKIIDEFEEVKNTISEIRRIRKEKNIAFKESLQVFVKTVNGQYNSQYDSIIIKSVNLSNLLQTADNVPNAISFIIKNNEFYVALGNLLNVEEELQKLETELKYAQGSLEIVMKKLTNERFVANAPANVIELERKKQADAESKITALSLRITELKG
jgi:valyl-tRNA synthetase